MNLITSLLPPDNVVAKLEASSKKRLFEQAGLQVIAAPTAFKAYGSVPLAPHEWMPRVASMRLSYWALHEWIGLAWAASLARVSASKRGEAVK